MKTDNLQQYVRLQRELTAEKASLESRLKQINEALGEVSTTPEIATPAAHIPSAAPVKGKRGRKPAGGGQSLREHVIAVLQNGAMTKEEILAAVQQRGYKFSTSNPLNSLGVILYGKNPKFNRADGKFSLSGGAASASAQPARGGKRGMSAAGKARIAEAQRLRWAKQKGNTVPAASAKPAGKRQISAAGRAAIAAAARKRWAAARRAGRTSL